MVQGHGYCFRHTQFKLDVDERFDKPDLGQHEQKINIRLPYASNERKVKFDDKTISIIKKRKRASAKKKEAKFDPLTRE